MRTITTRSWMTLSSSLLGLDWGYTTLPLLVAVGLHVTLELAVFVQAFSYTSSPRFRLVELMNQSLLFISSCIHYRVIHFWLPLDQLSLPCLFPSLFSSVAVCRLLRLFSRSIFWHVHHKFVHKCEHVYKRVRNCCSLIFPHRCFVRFDDN